MTPTVTASLAVSGLGLLVRWLLHVAAWSLVFHFLRGFLVHYTHVPYLGAIVVVAVLVASWRFAVHARRRRSAAG
ncbi:MAG: hypothetical protein J2P24_10200 [Streptosporangiales bacterium]|nr:hypothetical protein [Streptosporangiales bacterium]MBO0892688.1 hypothetical protein [Acidothermales bacterium]